MKTVGIRELKNRLSKYIRLVRSAETVLVTNRGVVAELVVPADRAADPSVPPELVALARQGLVVLANRTASADYPRLPLPQSIPGLAARLLDDERGQLQPK